jgi:putative membrane-bound dehydrogenase-like protein
MKSLALTWTLCLLLAAAEIRGEEPAPDLIARTPPLSAEEERLKLHVPPGFEVELVAAEPLIRKPMNIAFDDRGRIWATESVEYPFPVKEGAVGRDSVKVLEDTDGDGRADRVTSFAEGLSIPIGVIPLPDGAIVFSIPRIYRFRDKDGDGRGEVKEELYGPFGQVDTHGLTSAFRLGLDGWLYACHGYSNTTELKGADGRPVRMNSGNIYRMRIDGSGVEQFTHGQVNPFGLCFDPLGNLYSADCHSQPAYQLLRGGYYPSFGKPHDGLGYAPAIMNHDHGSTAIAGIVYYAADNFPEEYRDTIFMGNVVTNRINHDRLERHGSSVKAILQPDFLVSDDPWFRPVDLVLGPDGAIYVADFYNRIIGHYEVPLTHPGRDHERGRIWRIVYRGKTGGERPRSPIADFARASIPELVEGLGHPNLTVRTRATHALVERRGPEVVAAARNGAGSPKSGWTRVHALWVLERLAALDEPSLRRAAADVEAAVRVHLQRILAERRPGGELERGLMLAALNDPDPTVERAAADGLGRHPDPRNLKPLLDLRRKVAAGDLQLLHTVRMAIRDQLLLPGSWSGPAAPAEVDSDLVADVAPGIHNETAASYLLRYLERRPSRSGSLADQVQYLARYLPKESRDDLYQLVRSERAGDPGRRVALLYALQKGTEERGGELGGEMLTLAGEVARELLSSKEEGKVKSGIDLARGLKLAPLREELLALARKRERSEESRRLSMEALVAIDPRAQTPLLQAVLADASEPFSLREDAARLLGDVQGPEAIEALAKELASAPERLAARIAAGLVRSRDGAERLLAEVAKGKGSARLLKAREVEARLSRSGLPDLKERLEKLTAGLPEVDERLEKLIGSRRAGFAKASVDPARGAAVFEKSCAPCHRLGALGKKIGPELGGIGVRGLDRLLEDVLDPSRNVDQAFSTTVVVQKNGLLRTGLLLSDDSEVLVLADPEGKELRIPKREIRSRDVSPLSPMPSNVAETVPEADFYHLLGFLLAQKEKPVAAH